METAAQSAPSDLNDYKPSREEIIANILHVLSSSTEISPLLCRYDWGRRQAEEGNTTTSFCWDPFLSFAESMPDIDSGVVTHHSSFLRNWLIQLTNMGGIGKEDMMKIRNSFLDTSRKNKLLNGNNNKPSDDLLWQAGLNLLKSHLFPDVESDTDDDDNAGSHSSMDPILPHELLLVVTDSYYCNDDDLEMGELAAIIEVGMSPSEQVYRLPSSIAMFFLRTLLISRVLESAEESISDSRISSKPVRWRRLKSMVDDTLSLFQRMLFDYAGKAIDNFEYGRQPKSLKLYPVEPDHVISIATWMYTNHLFPSCRDLLWVLLRNNTDKSNGTGASGVKILETCYDSFRMLTSLLALDVAVVDQEYTAPSRCLQWVLKRMDSQSTSDFFDRVKSAQKEITHKDGSHDSMQDDGEEMYCPWNDKDPGFNGRGLSLEEDLLLYPSIRKKHDNSDKASSATFYDEMGIAVIAYWKLKAETDSASLALDPLPYPYCGSYRWTLLFPHVITFLCGSRASSTIKRMDELECLSMSDGYLLGINFTIISLGFDMLQTLITKTPAIRPMSCCTKTQNPIVQWAHSSPGLEPIISILFSHVVRISYLEASTENEPPSEANIALKYSSLEVMKMTQTLLGFYNPAIQIHTLSTVCHLIMTNQDRVLLPKALDFMRPIIMGMCTNIQQYNDDTIALDDMAIMQTISEVLGIFLSDLHYAFRDSTSSLPTDIDEFMSFAETYSSVFAIIRLQRIWIVRCQGAVEEELIGDREALELFYGTVKWMDVSLSKLQSFDSSLARLIDVWERSEDRPTNWHRLFLMKLALQDALTQPDE